MYRRKTLTGSPDPTRATGRIKHLHTLKGVCQYTLFDVGGVEMQSIECIEYCTKDQSNVEGVEDTLYGFQCIKCYVC